MRNLRLVNIHLELSEPSARAEVENLATIVFEAEETQGRVVIPWKLRFTLPADRGDVEKGPERDI